MTQKLFKLWTITKVILVFALGGFCSNGYADQTFLSDSEVSWGKHSAPYLDLLDALKAEKTANHFFSSSDSEFRPIQFRESLYVISKLRKMPTTIVYIHGLYGGASQFTSLTTKLIDGNSAVNSIHLTLPGHYYHGTFDQPIKQATKDDWIKAVEETLKIARRLSKQVIVVGQSTGGLLALYSALHFPESVDGIVLLEPALQVRTGITIATCLGKHVFTEASQVAFIAKALGLDAPKGVSVAMGCEVANLADQAFPKLPPRLGPKGPIGRPEALRYQTIARQIRIPVLMINNSTDHVVSYDANKEFSTSVSELMYSEIGQDGAKHGDSKTLATGYQSDRFYTSFCNFLVSHFRDENCFHEYFNAKVQPFKYVYFSSDSDAEIASKIKKLDSQAVSREACQMMNKWKISPQHCESFTAGVSKLDEIWKGLWADYLENKTRYQNFTEAVHGLTPAKKAEAAQAIELVDSFKNLFIGPSYRNLDSILSDVTANIEKTSQFAIALESDRGQLKAQCEKLSTQGWQAVAEAKPNQFVDSLLSNKLAPYESSIYNAFHLLEDCSQLDSLPEKVRSYVSEIKEYKTQVELLSAQEVPDPTSLRKVMERRSWASWNYELEIFDLPITKKLFDAFENMKVP